MKRFILQILGLWLTLLAALATMPARSETSYMSDIDIYSTTTSATAKPNVLLIVDNTGNWSTPFTREMDAIYKVIDSLPLDRIRLGVMMFTESGSPNTGPDGGYVRAAMRDLSAGIDPNNATDLSKSYKEKLKTLFSTSGLDSNNDKSNAGKAAMTMAEAYYYFASKAPVTGTNKVKTDRTDYSSLNALNATTYAASRAVYALGSNALPTFGATKYNSFSQDACSGNFIIFISNGKTQDPEADNTTASTALTSAYTALGKTRPTDITGLNPTGSQDNVADEWARFMRLTAPEAIQTFTLDINPDTTNSGLGWSALLASMAGNSDGEYIPVIDNASDAGAKIRAALTGVFNQILAKDGTFTSASLPVSVSARGAYLNQVFMGMFRPDASAKPRWRGNLKQYKFGYYPPTTTTTASGTVTTPERLVLEDATSPTPQEAIDPATGYFRKDALSYWTSDTGAFFVNDPMGDPLSAYDNPDGYVVEKGGAAQRLRNTYGTSQAGRRVYTCTTASCSDLTASTSAFVTTNGLLTTGDFGSGVSSTEKDLIINWVRGTNNVANDSLDRGPGTIGTSTITVRPSIHGDVLHSRPVVVNYGPNDTNNIVVFYGANDGMLHAINGNTSGTFGGAGPGEELWSFVPKVVMDKFKRLRSNTPEVKLSTTIASGTTPRDYLVDGPIGLYQKIKADGTPERAIIYVALRRGGRAIYAIDVTTPGKPQLLWTRANTDGNVTNDTADGSVTYDMSSLGQTWSEPRVARLKKRDTPVVIMGGGYDPDGEDSLSPSSSANMGNAIWVFDAITGKPLAKFPTDRSVPADVSLVDSDYDGYVDRAYASDVHGTIYRIDFDVTKTCSPARDNCGLAPADWRWSYVAKLSDKTASPQVIHKVFFAPDAVLANGFTALLVGTGDREKPLCGRKLGDAYNPSGCVNTADGFYTVFDSLPARPTEAQITARQDFATTIKGYDLPEYTASSKPQGCVITLPTSGEKVINAPLTVGGYTYFSTNTPVYETNVCKGNLGTSKVYGAKVFCQGFVSETRTLAGMAPSAVGGVVTVQYKDPNDSTKTLTKQVPFVIGGVSDPNSDTLNGTSTDKGCGLGGCKPKLTVTPTRTRKYWYLENPR